MDRTFDEAAYRRAEEVARLVIKKQHDYGPGNIMRSVVDPKIALAVRLTDKIARLVNLTEKGVNPENETLADTAADIMGYGLVLAMVLNGEFTLPLAEVESPQESPKTSMSHNIFHGLNTVCTLPDCDDCSDGARYLAGDRPTLYEVYRENS